MSPRVKAILQEVANDHGVTVSDLLGRERRQWASVPRFDAMRRLRALRNRDGGLALSLPALGAVFKRDHTTILVGLRRAENLFGPFPPIWPAKVSIDCEETRL